jgi:hypothetical protein
VHRSPDTASEVDATRARSGRTEVEAGVLAEEGAEALGGRREGDGGHDLAAVGEAADARLPSVPTRNIAD